MRAALYARVSSERQEHEETIQSQLAELRQRAREDGLPTWEEFLDEGYSRDNLARPSLERLRDLAGDGHIQRVYIHAPDRLASGVKLILLVDELRDHGAEVVFLRGAVEDTPEGKVFLHMQGAFAEYERTKITERTRRGRVYWARQGAIVGGQAPYGYTLIRRTEGRRASLEINESESSRVREIFRLLTEERKSLRGIALHLNRTGVPTPRGANQWQPAVILRMLRNPVYKGQLRYQHTERTPPAKTPNRKWKVRSRPQEEWILIPVPAILSEAAWLAAQAQLEQNARFSPRNNTHRPYLLRGLIRCPLCGGAFVGAARKETRTYQCVRNNSTLSSTGRKCTARKMNAEQVERAVWAAVTEAMRRPEALAQEYLRRTRSEVEASEAGARQKQIALAVRRLATQEGRLTEAYLNEAMELARYKEEMQRLRGRKEQLSQESREMERATALAQEKGRLLQSLQTFCAKNKTNPRSAPPLASGVEWQHFASPAHT
ncbi:MAG: recombinase family protein [Chloroflexi bacterium]|nr:recombinase family protein [Chloroflexota bacterium]